MILIPDKSMAAVKRLVQLSRAFDIDSTRLDMVQDGIMVPDALAKAYWDDVEVNPLATDPAPICGGATGAGATGPTGPAGSVGPAGPTGADSTVAGPSGPTGPAGPTGADSTVAGPSGPAGPTGADSIVAGPAGPTGATGPTGPAGPTAAAANVEPVACGMDIGPCGGIDPDVLAVFAELFTCLENQGIISDSWRQAIQGN